VRRGEVAHLPGAQALNEHVEATDEAIRFEQGGLRVLVRGDAEVVVDWDDGFDETIVEALLYGMAARQVLLHRGTFTVHGSLVILDGHGIAIGGHSGAGKSTTALELVRRHGATIAVDDVLPLRVEAGRVIAEPFPRPVHLTDEAVARAGMDTSGASRVGQGELAKLAVSLASPAGPVPVDLLVVLVRDEDDDAPPLTVTDPRGAERLRRVVRLSNVSGLASLGRRAERYFAWSTAVADALPTVEIVRATHADTVTEVGRLVAERVQVRR
jgi:hypothetical protein